MIYFSNDLMAFIMHQLHNFLKNGQSDIHAGSLKKDSQSSRRGSDWERRRVPKKSKNGKAVCRA
jgi:hypothetical protein